MRYSLPPLPDPLNCSRSDLFRSIASLAVVETGNTILLTVSIIGTTRVLLLLTGISLASFLIGAFVFGHIGTYLGTSSSSSHLLTSHSPQTLHSTQHPIHPISTSPNLLPQLCAPHPFPPSFVSRCCTDAPTRRPTSPLAPPDNDLPTPPPFNLMYSPLPLLALLILPPTARQSLLVDPRHLRKHVRSSSLNCSSIILPGVTDRTDDLFLCRFGV